MQHAAAGRASLTRATLLLTALVLTLTVLGCAATIPAVPGATAAPSGPPGPADPAPPAPGLPAGRNAAAVVQPRWTGCAVPDPPAEPPRTAPEGSGRIPDGFQASEVILCELGERTAANGDRVSVLRERRSAELTALLRYLARPAERPSQSEDLVCRAMAWSPPQLFLRDRTGRWLAPAVPTDPCGFALDLTAEPGPPYATLPYRDVAVRQLAVLETAAARGAGCAMQWKDMVGLEAAAGAAWGPLPDDPLGAGPVSRCRYAVPAGERPDTAAGEVASGTFVAGGRMSGDQLRAVPRALRRSSPAPAPCREPGRRFVVLQGSKTAAGVTVELDGCRRVLVVPGSGSAQLAQGTTELARLLAD